jgi:hypothetical protein
LEGEIADTEVSVTCLSNFMWLPKCMKAWWCTTRFILKETQRTSIEFCVRNWSRWKNSIFVSAGVQDKFTAP